MSDFMNALEKQANSDANNVSITENGAVGLKTTGSKLVDLNFMLSSMRNMDEDAIWAKFLEAYAENQKLAVIWLFFARDREQGVGERRTFRVIFEHLCNENPSLCINLIPLIPFYGRWDDVVDIIFAKVPCKVREAAFQFVEAQLLDDLAIARKGGKVSLLAKWMPSPATSSAETCRRANVLRCMLGWTPKQYRKSLAKLRKVIGVVEQDMSANKWECINYEHVPSRAAMNYRDAFRRHDEARYDEYLESVKSGEAKIHAGVLFPYDIVHAYMTEYASHVKPLNDTLEEQWKALPDTVGDESSTLVVIDGSGSMGSVIGNTRVTCHDVARALGIYFAERLKGVFHNRFITFSAKPQLVAMNDNLSLHGKIELVAGYDECSNTDIEKTFDLILDTAVNNNLKQDELPRNILVVTDGEFDQMTWRGGYGWWGRKDLGAVNETLFETIRKRWADAGYKLPRLVFWNVCSRTGTIPVSENELGVALVSGFSPNIAKMVMSGRLNPYECLLDQLLSGRYAIVEEALLKE